MDGKQVFSLVMLGLVIAFVIRLASCGLAMTSSPEHGVSEASYERSEPSREVKKAPSAVGAHYPKREPTPNVLLDHPVLFAVGAGVGVMGVFGSIGWLLLGGRRTPEVPAPHLQDAPQPRPAPRPAGAASGPVRAHAEAPIGDPSGPTASPKFNTYGIPEGYVEEVGVDWGSVAKGGAGLFVAGTILVLILIGPMNIAFAFGIWMESLGF